MKQILLSSNNKNKVREFRLALEALGYELLTPSMLGLDFEVEETGKTFDANAALKSEYLYNLRKIPCIADDSGLCVDALNGDPGVFSARFGGPGLDDRGRAELLLNKMKNVTDRNCHYFISLAYTSANGTMFFHGKCEGILAEDYDSDGQYGFGYDPIFYYPPLKERFSRVLPEEKSKVSHRGKALLEFIQYLKSS